MPLTRQSDRLLLEARLDRGSARLADRIVPIDGPAATTPAASPGVSCRPASRCTCNPAQARLPGPRPWWWARTTSPDVVLEVDHTTDVHRGKLALYESWGFPECGWRCRTRRRRAGRTCSLGTDDSPAGAWPVPGRGREPGFPGHNRLAHVPSVSGQRKETSAEIDTQPRASQVIQSQNAVDTRAWRQSMSEDRKFVRS